MMRTKTKIKQQTVLELLKENLGNVQNTCSCSLIGRTQFYEWMKKYPQFKAEVDGIYSRLRNFTSSRLIVEARKGEIRAIERINKLSKKRLGRALK